MPFFTEHTLTCVVSSVSKLCFRGSYLVWQSFYKRLNENLLLVILSAILTCSGFNPASKVHTSRVSSLGVTDDGFALCTASWDGTLRIWA